MLGLVSSFSPGHSFGLKSDCKKIGSDEKPLWNQNLFEILFQKSQFNQRQQKIRQYRSENISKPSSHTLLQLLVHMQQQLLVLDLKLSSKQHAACRFWVMFQENTINHRFQIWTCWLIYANLMNDLHNAEPPQSFKVCQILVHLNSSFLPFFASLRSPSLSAGRFRERTHVRNLLLALVRSHSPSLLLGKAARSDLDRKKWTFILEALLASKKTALSFSTNFNMFQVSQSICTFSVSGEFGLAETEETLWFMPHDSVPPVREMEQQKLFNGCLLRTHCWPIMGFGSSLTRISETNDLALAV